MEAPFKTCDKMMQQPSADEALDIILLFGNTAISKLVLLFTRKHGDELQTIRNTGRVTNVHGTVVVCTLTSVDPL